jgi:hypothetical protein
MSHVSIFRELSGEGFWFGVAEFRDTNFEFVWVEGEAISDKDFRFCFAG